MLSYIIGEKKWKNLSKNLKKINFYAFTYNRRNKIKKSHKIYKEF